MLSTLLTLAAAADARPITPNERSIIERVVGPEAAGSGTIGVEPVPAAASIVCGRVNGSSFKVAVTRNSSGKITAAERPVVLTDSTPAVIKLSVMETCLNQGYVKF